jgi:Caspase domain
MKNLGIIIGVRDYTPPTGNLPACRPDAQAIAKLFQIETRFEEILYIDSDTRSSVVKQKIIEFINAHKDQEIGDVVFYFSGHGDFSGDEFFYLLTDYDPKRRKQTALENSELDNLVRLLKPKLFVKIVDACHSGVTYIKNADEFQTYLKGAIPQFKKLYFMFSSQSDQYSYQDAQLSYFTRRVIESIVQHEASTIRYKDIIDYVSDAFEGDSTQTPFFVTQAEFTEMFSDHVAEIKDAVIGIFSASGTQPTLPTTVGKDSLVDRIKKDAELYCTEADALDRVNKLPVLFSAIQLSNGLAEIYEITAITQQDAAPGSSSVGLWLDQNKEAAGYFCRVTRERRPVTTRVPKDPLRRLTGMNSLYGTLGDDDYTNVTETREYIVGYGSTVKLPYSHIRLSAEPKYPNVNPAAAFIVPIISMTHLRLFWAFALYDYLDWKERKRIGKLDWATDEAALTDWNRTKELVDFIISKFLSYLEAPIRAKWGEPEEPKSVATKQGEE